MILNASVWKSKPELRCTKPTLCFRPILQVPTHSPVYSHLYKHMLPLYAENILIITWYNMSGLNHQPQSKITLKSPWNHYWPTTTACPLRRTYVDAIALEYAKRAEATGACGGLVLSSHGGKHPTIIKPKILVLDFLGKYDMVKTCKNMYRLYIIDWWFSIAMVDCLVGFYGDVIGVWWRCNVFVSSVWNGNVYTRDVLWWGTSLRGFGTRSNWLINALITSDHNRLYTTRADSPVFLYSPVTNFKITTVMVAATELLGVYWCFNLSFGKRIHKSYVITVIISLSRSTFIHLAGMCISLHKKIDGIFVLHLEPSKGM